MEQNIQEQFDDLRKHDYLVFIIRTESEILQDDYNFEICLRNFNLRIQQKILGKKFKQDRIKSLLNQTLLYFVSSLVTENLSKWKDLKVDFNQFGKPYILDTNFQFSLSNSQDFVSMVVELNSSDEIGIDLSNVRDVISDLSLYESIFHETEYKNLASHADLKLSWVKLFNQYWALKESYTKLLGVGLNIDLSSFYFDPVKLLAGETSSPTLDNSPADDEIKNNKIFNVKNISWDNSVRIHNVAKPYNFFLAQIDDSNILSIVNQNPQSVPVLVEVNFEKLFEFITT